MNSTVKTILSLSLILTAALGSAAHAQNPKTVFTVVRDTQWGSENYNPFVPGDQHLLPTNSALYESLFFVNSINSKVTPVLGTKYTWSKDSKTLTVNTREGVKWHDGKAFSASDAAFSFNYLKSFPALDTSGIWKSGLSSVKATNPTTLVFTFTTPNTPIFQYIAATPMVPEHLWKDVKDPSTFTNTKPVGTGPFVADSYSQQALRVLKNPNYWMKGQPYVDALVWLATSTNDAAQLKLLSGEADYGYIGIPDPKAFAAKSPNTSYWWPTNNINFLYFNTAKAPFNDPAFRRAVARAINTKEVAQKAYAGAVPAASPAAIFPGQQKEWLSSKVAPQFDAAAADKALTAAGYKKDSSGNRLGKDGKALPSFKILVGAGWTDFITMAQVIGNDLKKVGIKTSIDQQAWGSYSGGLQTGSYDMGISWGWGNGSTPYYTFNAAFNPDFSAPVGKTAASNLSRYTNPAITKALKTFSGTSDESAQQKAIDTIVAAVMKDQPWVPLTDRVNFALFNTSKFTGFPSAENPYNDASPDDTAGARLMYLNVKPK
ncbi:ABC transporter substrate-binding protein [Deinococcus radiopugnans]|uniref:ABC transporter substrate-binding protein n=1 Tax=Deinococcus radiopugnans ATCC 19172 TaxID=585398 RepID=A0A5C4Y6N3_9DEIO|nr:ABC transporter substrate-binding protein [Deinococcus radiopugnans]MBB6015035.1 peptide/nickel transport system substrate-binding protein [Deinococcus radiopugnans ATCC 19172]TNM70986.1 ABC transporter substrate-binding protein [Deinococcus radiopugnans ATCC 19172]